jgi:CHAT domain-containing protein
MANALGEREWAARAKGELGIIAFLEGDTGTAVSLVGTALLSALTSGDFAEQIRLLSMLGNGYNEVRRFKESTWFFQHAISIAEKTPDAGFTFMAHEGMASALNGLGRHSDAQVILQNVLAKARSQGRHDEESQTLILLGETAMETGESNVATNDFRDAAYVAENSRFYRMVAHAMSDEAILYQKQGDLKSAETALIASLRASQKLGDTYYLPGNFAGLAEVKAAEHKTEEADRLFRAAEDLMDGILVNAHSRIASQAMVDLVRETYVEHFKLLQKRGNVRRAVNLIERFHSRRSASHMAVSNQNDAKSDSVALLESNISNLQLKLLQTEDQNARVNLLDKLSQLERNLAYEQNEVDHRQFLSTTASLSEIQQSLRKDEEFIEYVLDEPSSFCIVITKHWARILTLPTGGHRVKKLTEAYVERIKDTNLEAARELYRILLQPVLYFRKSRIIISNDGVLGLLPFESLQDGNGNYLIQSRVVTYVPSGSSIWAQRRLIKHGEAPRAVLALGDVDYTHALAQSSVRKVPLPSMMQRGLEKVLMSQVVDLPESREEVLSITRAIGGRSTVLLGREASEAAFKSEPISDFSVIHMAVHALPDSQYPERASLILGFDPSASDDGLLQVREIMHLQLNADLVTLSACETGRSGDAGVVSLGEAFLMAGARAVVVSLWNVEDHSTTLLMEYFYSHLAHGEDKAEALAHAKRDFIARHQDASPFYWAGFVMIGEGAATLSFKRQ